MCVDPFFFNEECKIADSDVICYIPEVFPENTVGKTFKARKDSEIEGAIEGIVAYRTFEECEIDLLANCSIVECFIPKGTKYLKGYYFGEAVYICDEITHVKVVHKAE